MPLQLPYTWLNPILMVGSVALILAAIAMVAFSFASQSFSKSRIRRIALASLLMGLALGASNYALIFFVQLPSFARHLRNADQERVNAASRVTVGQKVPAFRIKKLDGAEVGTDSLRGRVVLLNFFATWCGPCMLELPSLQEIWNSHGNRADFSMLVIGREETDGTLAEFKAKHGYSFPMVADPERRVYSRFAKELIPRTYLISKDGTVVLAITGYREERLEELNRELAKQLGGSI